MTGQPFAFVDADQHYYEQYDCFSRHIEAPFAERAVRIVKNEQGLGEIWQGDRRLIFQPFIPTDFVAAPGALKDFFGQIPDDKEGLTDDWFPELIDTRSRPGFVTDRNARLELLDSQNVEATIMLPSMGVCVEHQIHDDPEALYANVRSFNRWIEEEWGFGGEGRIFSPAVLSLVDLDLAVAELERVVAAGARLVNLRPGPVYGRSPADPFFDPFWARVEEAGVLVTLHSGDSGYTEFVGRHWGEETQPNVFELSAFQHFAAFIERPIIDTIAAFVLHNLFARFPRLRVLSIESGASWVPPLAHQLDHAWLLGGRSERNLGGPVTEKPSVTMRGHVYVSPFVEEDIHGIADVIGSDRIIMGSDFPHPEGNAEPGDFLEKLTSFSPDDVRRIMRSNLAELLCLAP